MGIKLTEKQLNLLNRRKIIVLATADLQAQPRAIFVEVNQVKDDKIVITDNEMITTRENLLKNKRVALLAFEEDYSYGLKILGETEYFTEGEYFDFVKNLEANEDFSPKGAVVITVKEIVEFK